MGCCDSKDDQSKDGDGHKHLQKKMELNEMSWEDYISIDKEICAYQKRHVVEMLKVRREQLKQLKDNAKRMEDELKRINKDISKERNVSSTASGTEHLVKNYIMKQEKYDELAAYEKAEHVALLNRKEILKKELAGTQQHKVELAHECELLQEDVDDLKELCETQDKLLDKWFDGDYGSALENELEEELDWLEVKMHKYEEANFKWRQAQVMVEYACKQIGTAVSKWEDIVKLPNSAMESKYRLAEETRNNLIAAGQNLQGAHRYLPHIHFPYCTPEEVVMLNKATSYVFTDMQAKDRQRHALECYAAAHTRSGALLQWFNQTINMTIRKSLMDAKDRTKKVRKELRKERANLIVKLIKDKLGKTVQVPSADIDIDDDSEMDFHSGNAEDKNRKSSSDSVTVRGSYAHLDYKSVPMAPSPLPLQELAPPPSKQQLFGPLDEQEHERQMNRKNRRPSNVAGRNDHGAKPIAGPRRGRGRLPTEYIDHQQHGGYLQNGAHHLNDVHHTNNKNNNYYQQNQVPNQVMDYDDDDDYVNRGHNAVKKATKRPDRY